MANIELLLEAERRGLLPPEKAQLLAEARNRGLLAAQEEIMQPDKIQLESTAVDSPKIDTAFPTVESTLTSPDLSQFKRPAGLTARYALEGLGDVAGIVGNPIAALTGTRRPSETISGIADVLNLPKPETDTEKLVGAGSRAVAGSGSLIGAGKLLGQAPGMFESIGNWLTQYPAAQLASSASGGMSSELAKQQGVGPTGQALAGVAGSVAPTLAAKAIPAVGRGLAEVVGGAGTRTGGESLKQAAIAGFEGGKKQKVFTENLRGKVPIADVLDDARENLQRLGQAKSLEYRSGMSQVSGDKSVLSFSGIDKAVKDSANIALYKGQIKNARAAQVQQDIADAVKEWKSLNPAEFHTPEGLDALKQRIGGMIESIPYEEKTARTVGNNIYNAIKNEITKQAPVYSKVMKDYTQASELIHEIERTLVNPKASTDTAMRKLQSLMRNNVNTNYGNRLELARQLEKGGNEILPALAGQSLNALTSRGLGNVALGGTALGGYAMGGAPAALAIGAVQSPRAMGELALKLGQGARAFTPAAPLIYPDIQNAISRGSLSELMSQ